MNKEIKIGYFQSIGRSFSRRALFSAGLASVLLYVLYQIRSDINFLLFETLGIFVVSMLLAWAIYCAYRATSCTFEIIRLRRS